MIGIKHEATEVSLFVLKNPHIGHKRCSAYVYFIPLKKRIKTHFSCHTYLYLMVSIRDHVPISYSNFTFGNLPGY